MLRRQQYSVDLGEVQYVAPPKKTCVSRKQRIEEAKKEACGVGVLKPYDVDEYGMTLSKIKGNMLDNITKLNNQFKDHGCNPLAPSCIPIKTCLAKTSTLHDGTDVVEHDLVGLGVKHDGNTGNLYNTYRQLNIVDTQALIAQIRAGRPTGIQDQITKMSEYNAGLYGGSFHEIDGVPTGYSCITCPPRKRVCPPYPPKCKIPDPNNPETGIGSDLMESKESLLGLFEARRIDETVSVKDFQQAEGDRLGYQGGDVAMDMEARDVEAMVNPDGTVSTTTTSATTPSTYGSLMRDVRGDSPRELQEGRGVLAPKKAAGAGAPRAAKKGKAAMTEFRQNQIGIFGQVLEPGSHDEHQWARGLYTERTRALEQAQERRRLATPNPKGKKK